MSVGKSMRVGQVGVVGFVAVLGALGAACSGEVSIGAADDSGTQSSSRETSSNGISPTSSGSGSSSGSAMTGTTGMSGTTGTTVVSGSSGTSSNTGTTGTMATSGSTGSSGGALGAGCVPSEEADATFQGFSVDDVSLETKSSMCSSNVCLVNHFQGRVTCPYGQTAPGTGPSGPAGSPAAAVSSQDGCVLPGMTAGTTSAEVTATNVNLPGQSAGHVPAQIIGAGASDRTANKTVYCSCRCANAEGATDDGATYCGCPESYTCTQLVASFGQPNDTVSGAYCVLDGTVYNPALSTNETCTASVTSPTQVGYCPLQQ